MIWAYLTSWAAFTYHGNNRGKFTMRIPTSGVVNGGGASDGNRNLDFFFIHGWLMWAAWTVFGLIQVASNRYLKPFWRVSMWVYRISGALILLITAILGGLGLLMMGWQFELTIHSIMGLIMLIVVLFPVIGGVFTSAMMNRL